MIKYAKSLTVLSFVALISGCVSESSTQRSQSPSERCIEYGHKRGSTGYSTCVGNETRLDRQLKAEKKASSKAAAAAWRKSYYDRYVNYELID